MADFILNVSGKDHNVSYFDNRDYFLKLWIKNRAAIEGEEAVKLIAEDVLTKTPLMREDDTIFEEYVRRASYFNAVGRTTQGMLGMLFRNDPSASNVLPKIEKCYQWFSNQNESIEDFAQRLVNEQFKTNLNGILIDFPRVDEKPLNAAEAERLNLAPYATLYPAESIIDLRYSVKNNRSALRMAILHETVTVDVNEFEQKEQHRIRVLDIDPEGFYRQRVFSQPESQTTANTAQGARYNLESEIYPLINGKKVGFIPFIPISGNGINFNPSKPILNDLVNVNLKLFSNSADYEMAIHEVCNPTPVFKGLVRNPQTGEFDPPRLGIFAGVILDPEGDAKYMQAEGAGIELTDTAMDKKKTEMALLGAKILNPEKRVAETAESLEIARSGENSILMSIANNISAALEEALYYMALWSGVAETEAEQIEYKLNTNYLSKMSADDAQKWAKTWIDGALTNEELFDIYKQGEVIDPDKTFEDHQKEIKASRKDDESQNTNQDSNSNNNTEENE